MPKIASQEPRVSLCVGGTFVPHPIFVAHTKLWPTTKEKDDDSGTIVFQHQMDEGSSHFYIVFEVNKQIGSACRLVLASALYWLASVLFLCNITIIKILLLLLIVTSVEGPAAAKHVILFLILTKFLKVKHSSYFPSKHTGMLVSSYHERHPDIFFHVKGKCWAPVT